MKHFAIPLLLFPLLTLTSCDEGRENIISLPEELQISLNDINQREEIRGISAAILVNDELVTAAAGNSTSDVAVTNDMIFASGSVSKTFTATVVLHLVDDGIINLDDPISKWIDSFPNIDPAITIDQLLTHTSGIFSYTSNEEFVQGLFQEPDNMYHPVDILAYVEEPLFDRGTSWSYSNTNYLLLGMIVEASTGMAFHRVLRTYIIEPLQLRNTLFPPFEDLNNALVAHSWLRNTSGELEDTFGKLNAAYSGAWTAGAIHSTSADLVMFLRALMQSEIISQGSLDKMVSFVAVNNEAHSHFGGYGYGVMQFFTVREFWGHSGDFFGYRTNMIYVPQDNVFIAFHINQEIDESTRVQITTELIQLAVKYAES